MTTVSLESRVISASSSSPVIPGIIMSERTRSYDSSFRYSSASMALPAVLHSCDGLSKE